MGDENPVERMVRDYQDRITRGTFEGVYGLSEEGLDRVMRCQASACVQAYAELYRIPADLDLESFLARLEMGGSSKIRIRRKGDSLLWEELHEGRCVCPLVTRGVIPLRPELCRCAVHWVRMLVERHVRGPVEVELLGSAAYGDENCVFRVLIPHPIPPERSGSQPRGRSG